MGKNLKGKELGKGISQRKDGRYTARYTNSFGKRIENNSLSLPEMKKWLRDSLYEDEHGMLGNGENITVDKWFYIWVDNYKKDVVAYSTYKNYLNSYKNHVKPAIGNLLLKNVKPINCQKILNELWENAFSYGTANLCRITMHALFDGAVENDYLIVNPVNSSVKCKQREKDERRVLTIEEQKIFMEYSENTIYDNAFKLILQTGLRCGEVGGLMWDDIDFEAKTLKVKRTLLNQKGGFYLGKPKTKASNRIIPLTDKAIAILKNQKVQLFKMRSAANNWDTEKQFQDLVFKTKNGRPVGNSNFSSALIRIVNRINSDRMISERLGESEYIEFESVFMHCLRHTYATRAIENGMKPKVLQKILGHSNIATTMDLYVHVTVQELAKEANKINGAELASEAN